MGLIKCMIKRNKQYIGSEDISCHSASRISLSLPESRAKIERPEKEEVYQCFKRGK